jgi:putative nucleotidyltransferase with HDIG domain
MTINETTPTPIDDHPDPSAPHPDLRQSDPLPVLKGLVNLHQFINMYPPGHPMINQKLSELDDTVQQHLRSGRSLCIDIVGPEIHYDGVAWRADTLEAAPIIRELADLGVHSIHIQQGVQREELRGVSAFLSEIKQDACREQFTTQLARRGISHVSLASIVPLDTRWRTEPWPDAPTGPLDPAYAESLVLAQQTFETVAAGGALNLATVRGLVELMTSRVVRSSAALSQILAMKHYENLTYCHSVNVALISLLLGKRLALDEPMTTCLVEAALLHDMGKTRVPLEIVKKPTALDKNERKTIEKHTIFGAEILIETNGVHPLSATVALEHHRGIKGGGYPDLGEDAVPHLMTQIVTVADVYEAVTAARWYHPPRSPEQACLILARQAGSQFNTTVVKALVSTVTFFPLGSLVRTNRGENGIVIRTNPDDPLHPHLMLLNEDLECSGENVDTRTLDASGTYERHIVETLNAKDADLDLTRLLPHQPMAE